MTVCGPKLTLRAEVTRERPDFSIDFVRHTHLFGVPDLMARYCEGLCKGAVPQTA
jgi:hypothetical protein